MIKVSNLLIEVTKVATRNPDVKYLERVKQFDPEYSASYCRYEVAGNPACIIGVALNNLGVSVDELTQFDSALETGINGIIDDFTAMFEVDDRSAVDDLKTIQNRQDNGWIWGESIAEVRV